MSYILTRQSSDNTFQEISVTSKQDITRIFNNVGNYLIGFTVKYRNDDGTLGGVFNTTSEYDGEYWVSDGSRLTQDSYGRSQMHQTSHPIYVFDGIVYDTKQGVTEAIEREGFTFSDFF